MLMLYLVKRKIQEQFWVTTKHWEVLLLLCELEAFFSKHFLGSFPYCGDDGSWLCANQWNLSLFHGVFRRKKVMRSEFYFMHCFDYCVTLAANVHQCLYYTGNIHRLCYTICLIQFSQMLFPVHVYCMY